MKKIRAFVLFMILLSSRLFSLELEVSGGLGNLAFDSELDSSLSVSEGTFEPDLFPLVNFELSGESGAFSWNSGFQKDPVLRNRLFGNLKAEFGFFNIEAGPFIGLFNTKEQPLNPGISAALGLEASGIIFAEAGASSGFGTEMELEDHYSQSSGYLRVGFWVPHVICSLNMETQNYLLRETANLLVGDESVRYFFTADVYTKNVPYTVKVDLGYQSLKRSYTSESVASNAIVKNTDTDEFKSIFIGVEGRYAINAALAVFLGGEMPVYSWGKRPMQDPPKDSILFKAWGGFTWTLPAAQNQK